MSAPLSQVNAPATKHRAQARAHHTPAARAWYRIRLAIREMNDASRRQAELEAPWAFMESPRRK